MQTWNPNQYERFKEQRAQPFMDLMNLLSGREQRQAVDLGCGTGELTAKLFDHLGAKHLTGLDSSKQMLEKAQAFAKPGLEFHLQNIESFQPPQPLDLLFSNAALQWTANHEELFPKLLSWVRKGGEVAIQMPCNTDHPSHRLAAEVGHELFPEKFSADDEKLKILSLERYAEILYAHGFHQQHCRVQIYGTAMESGRDVVEWTKGSLLTAYQAQLTESEFAQFLKNYEARLISEIGSGAYFYTFKRLLLWGVKE